MLTAEMDALVAANGHAAEIDIVFYICYGQGVATTKPGQSHPPHFDGKGQAPP